MECNRLSDIQIVQKQSLDDQQTQHMPNSRLLSILYSTKASKNVSAHSIHVWCPRRIEPAGKRQERLRHGFEISASYLGSSDYSWDNTQTIYEPSKTVSIDISLPPDWTTELRRTDGRFVCTTWSESARVDGFEFLVGPIGEEWSIN